MLSLHSQVFMHDVGSTSSLLQSANEVIEIV